MADEVSVAAAAPRRVDLWFLLAVCAAEVFLLSRSAPVFFDGDAFFYFAHPVENLSTTLLSADITRVYRPLGSLLFSYVFQPLFGFDHGLYAKTALAFHVANTMLVFALLFRLLESPTAARVGTLFFGLNPVAIYVTHSFSFLADFSYSFFYLCAALSFVRHTRTRSRSTFLLTLIAFLLALLSKELAITLPALLVVIALSFLRGRPGSAYHEAAAQRLVWTTGALLVAYLAFYSTLKGGSLYDSTPGRNYFPQFDVDTLLAKVSYFQGALFMPVAEKITSEALLRIAHRLVYVVAPAVGLFAVFLLAPPAALARGVRGGLLWAVLVAAPVLFLSPVEFTHNLYLPAAGLGIAFGLFWQYLAAFGRESGWLRPELLHAYGLGAVALSQVVNQQLFWQLNWRPHWEEVARTWVTDVRTMFPALAPPTQVFVMKSSESDRWSLYDGDILRVFLKQPSLSVLFDDNDAVFPADAVRKGQALALTMMDRHVRNVSATFLTEADQNAASRPSLVRELARGHVSLLNGKLLDQVRFETPTGSPAFVNPVLVGGEYRPALITLAGTRVRFDLVVDAGARITFGLAKRFEMGDGVVARVFFEGTGGRQLLYEGALNPRDIEKDRRWLDVSIDLAAVRGQYGTLELECTPGAQDDYTADWLGWSGLFLENARLR